MWTHSPHYSAVPLAQPTAPIAIMDHQANDPLIWLPAGVNDLPAPVVGVRGTSAARQRWQAWVDAIRSRAKDRPSSARSRVWHEVNNRVFNSKKTFPSGTFACPICCDTVDEVDRAVLSECGNVAHSCCQGCMGNYIRGLVRDGRVDLLRCPANEYCSASVLPLEIAAFTDEDTYGRYERFRRMRSDPTLRQCPQCETFCKPIQDEEGGFVADMLCGECGNRFCYYHSNAHVGRSCQDYLNETATETITDAKECTGCGILTEKISGCNHMTCSQCKSEWCWLCGKSIDDVAGHYSDANPDGCRQFENCEMLEGGSALVCLFLSALLVVSIFAFFLIKYPFLVVCCCCLCCSHSVSNAQSRSALDANSQITQGS